MNTMDADLDPHWPKILDPEPHWNQCGSTTLILLSINYNYLNSPYAGPDVRYLLFIQNLGSR